MYKLIALDMDGTLLNEDKTISMENLEAIENARKNGVKVVLATGRPIKGIEKYLKELNLITSNDYAVTFNGAIVQNTKTGEVIAQNLLDVEDAEYLYNLIAGLGVGIFISTPNSCITPEADKYSILETTMNNIPLEVLEFNRISKKTTVVKVIVTGDEDTLSEAIKKLPKEIYNKYTVVRSAPFFLEFINRKVNKGFGVELLANSLGIKQQEVICMGDAGNDVHMIKYAGLGVAMGNAFPEVKKIANYVTKTNVENGVAHVINKFILEDCKAC